MAPKLERLLSFQPFGRLGRHYLKSFIRWIRTLSGLSVYDLTHYHKNNTEGHSP